MELLERAYQAVAAATAGGRLHREKAIEWYELRMQATGEEGRLIGEAAEALMVAATTPEDRSWLRALVNGDPTAAERVAMAQRMQDEAMQFEPAGRGDAADGEEEQEHGGSGGLDWGLIGRETQAMMRLNPQDRSEIETEADGNPEG